MANIANYGLKALVAEERICDEPDCPCKDNQELVRKQTNRLLGPLHQLDSATYQAICLDLDQNPISDRPATSTGEKQRDDGDFDRIAVEAFKVRPPPNIHPRFRWRFHNYVALEKYF